MAPRGRTRAFSSFVEFRRENHVAVVTLARPEALNAFSSEMADGIGRALVEASSDRQTWALVLAAAGEKAFCVGADLKERQRLDDAEWLQNRVALRSMFDALRAVPQPTIASVFGYALGGGFELALSCDFIVAAQDAMFGLPEVTVGVIPGGGGTQLLARKVGLARAKDIVLTGRRITAAEARDIGLISRMVPREELQVGTMELVGQICRASPAAVREAKWAVDRGVEVPLEHGIELEDVAWRRAVASEDRREGIAAFNAKREPRWKGR